MLEPLSSDTGGGADSGPTVASVDSLMDLVGELGMTCGALRAAAERTTRDAWAYGPGRGTSPPARGRAAALHGASLAERLRNALVAIAGGGPSAAGEGQ
jgi:hypothetical protein